ncbi:MAG: AAA family ATPase [Infirmifilum sp.]|uniref:AAA family ATPase n=1 Tax=Infirmifilum TaxID=2856573 RepID=UPI003C72D855
MKAKLRRLEVNCFRGFRSQRIFEFPDGVTVVVGPVGSGKSSILSAIQFALYGFDFNTAMNLYQRESLINVECERAEVQLTLEVPGDGLYQVGRSLDRSGGRLRETVFLKTPQGDVVNGSVEVEAIIEELLGLDFQEFIRSVSLGYVLVHMLAYGRQASRSRALDILLGIRSIRAFYESLNPRRIKKEVDELRRNLEDLRREYSETEENYSRVKTRKRELESKKSELQKRLSDIQGQLKQLEEPVRNYLDLSRKIEDNKNYANRLREKIKHSPSELDPYRIMEEVEYVKRELRDVFEKLVVSQDYFNTLEKVQVSSENLHQTVALLEKLLDDAWRRYDRVWEAFQSSVNELEQRRGELRGLEKLLVELEPIISEYEEAEERLQELEAKYGTQEKLEKEFKKIEEELRENMKKLQQLKSIQQLKQSLAESALRRTSVTCPVCGSQIDSSIIDELRSELSQIAKQVLDYEKKIQENEKRLKELRALLEDIRGLKVTLVSREPDYDRYRDFIQRKEDLEEEIREDELVIKGKEHEYRSISAVLTSLDEKIGDLKRKLNEYSLSLEILKTEKEIAELEEQRKELEPYFTQYTKLKEEEKQATDALTKVEAELSALEESYVEQHLEELSREISGLESKISNLENLYVKLEKVRNTVRQILDKQRREKIEALNRRINEIIRKVYPSESIRSVELEIIEKYTRKGAPPASYYDIYVNTGSGRYKFNELLSDGQKTIVILSVLLAIYSQTRHKAGFIMLDEPLPNVDDEIKLAFLTTLAESEDIPQVIVTTQAEELTTKVSGINIIRLR